MQLRTAALVALLIVCGSCLFVDDCQASPPLLGRRIALDPGHGGIDPGACRGDLSEESIVLELSKQLAKMLAAAGADVRLTRETDCDLAERVPRERSESRKRRDIIGRVELVNSWQPDILLSLHVNAIAASRWRGAQVFYQMENDQSKALAETLQQALERVLKNTDRQPKPGDYRILNDAEPLSVLVEIGFISNPEEARLLADPSYLGRVAWAVQSGLMHWWGARAVER